VFKVSRGRSNLGRLVRRECVLVAYHVVSQREACEHTNTNTRNMEACKHANQKHSMKVNAKKKKKKSKIEDESPHFLRSLRVDPPIVR